MAMASRRRRALRVSSSPSASSPNSSSSLEEIAISSTPAPSTRIIIEEDDEEEPVQVRALNTKRPCNNGTLDRYFGISNQNRTSSTSVNNNFTPENLINQNNTTPSNPNNNISSSNSVTPANPTFNINITPTNPSNINSSFVNNEVIGSRLFSSLPVQAQAQPSPSAPVSDHGALASLLENRGIKPSSEWLTACVNSLVQSRPGFRQMPLLKQAELCFSKFLVSDLNTIGAGVLPPQFDTLHATELVGPFVLQVDEILDISSAIRSRYKERNAGTSRCLKLSMTDGVQRIYGIEYRPIKDLNVLAPAGLKIAVHHVNIRRGLLMLVPEVIIVLGGQVEHLEDARRRVVEYVNKPPRGSRFLRGSNQNLAASATNAAWSTAETENGSRSGIDIVGDDPRPGNVIAGDVSRAGNVMAGDVSRSGNVMARESLRPGNVMAGDVWRRGNVIIGDVSRSGNVRTGDASRSDNERGTTQNINNMLIQQSGSRSINVHPGQHGTSNQKLTYLSLLKQKWSSGQLGASNFQGKIKCVLTGVKEFKFKNLTEFKLVVYIDDGSEIAMVMIQNKIVEQLIGFTPMQVTAGITSSVQQEVINMKENLSRFQAFLTKFEGILLVKKDNTSGMIVAMEMTGGCPKDEAWLLAQRLLESNADANVDDDITAIELSP